MINRTDLSGWLQKAASGVILAGLILATPCIASGPPPVITVQPQSQDVPLLGIVTFSVTASSGTTMTYQWFKDGVAIAAATSSSYTILTLLGSDSGTFAVKVTNAGGSVMSANAYLNIVPPPTITAQPQSQAVTQGQNVSFSVVVSGSGSISYQWYFNGASLGGAAKGPAYSVNNVLTANAGNYTVVVGNSTGSATSAVATLTVLVPPAIQTQPNNQTVRQDQNASFSVAASGSAPFSYQWKFNGTNVSGATDASLTLTNVQTSQSGDYTVVVTNPAGSVTSQVATLTVNLPPTITAQPQSQMVTQGQNVSFSVMASGSGPLSYQWYFNGLTLLGSTAPVLTLTNVQTSQSGDYTVVVVNTLASASSAVASLAVTPTKVTLSLSDGGGMVPNGFTFQSSVPAGRTYVIFASTDLLAWTPIATNVAATASVAFTDVGAANQLHRFYRIVLQ